MNCSFNPRPRKEGDLLFLQLRLPHSAFNPRPRKEGDISNILSLFRANLFQSTPSQRGRHLNIKTGDKVQVLSIHALAKRATTAFGSAVGGAVLSIHALAKRATRCALTLFLFFRVFQSTPSQRGRLFLLCRTVTTVRFQSTPSQRGRPVSILYSA